MSGQVTERPWQEWRGLLPSVPACDRAGFRLQRAWPGGGEGRAGGSWWPGWKCFTWRRSFYYYRYMLPIWPIVCCVWAEELKTQMLRGCLLSCGLNLWASPVTWACLCKQSDFLAGYFWWCSSDGSSVNVSLFHTGALRKKWALSSWFGS